MHILRKNTSPSFDIVPRVELNPSDFFHIHLKNEYTNLTETISCIVNLLPNENYNLILSDFPIGNINEKLSFVINPQFSDEVLLMGQIMIVDENEIVQDYTKKTNTKYSR